LKYPADIEAWLELALTVIDYDLSCQDMDAYKEVSSKEREQWMVKVSGVDADDLGLLSWVLTCSMKKGVMWGCGDGGNRLFTFFHEL
jgi:hypothetical protein